MYFDFEDYRPDITPVGTAISWREGVLLSVILHLLALILVLMFPSWFPTDPTEFSQRAAVQAAESPSPRFVFVAPLADVPAPRPPDRADASDQDRLARAPEPAREPENALPLSRGNTAELVERAEAEIARGDGPTPEPAAEAADPTASEVRLPETQTALSLPSPNPLERPRGIGDRVASPGGSLGDSLRNLQRYVESSQFDNQQGGGSFGPDLQFDTKGVEFGPWVRRFITQVKGNWLIPMAAMSMHGRVVITFNVHKSGLITDLSVVSPAGVDAFNSAAYGALVASNPTAPLPPEYPADKAFFTVTFYYNEDPR